MKRMFPQTVTVPVYERDADGVRRDRGLQQLELSIEVDVASIAQQLVGRATRSKARRASALHGAIVVKVKA